MHSVFVKLFTRSVLTDPEQGRTLIRLIGEHVPSWLPQRFGWSAPLRNVYDPVAMRQAGFVYHGIGRP